MADPGDAADVGGTTSGGGTDGGTSGGTTGGNNGGGTTTPTATTIAEIQTGVVATGDLVEISNAVVTGVSENMRQVFVQDTSGTEMQEHGLLRNRQCFECIRW